MSDYTLMVFHEGDHVALETVSIAGAAAVTDAIVELLARHPGCHRIRVFAGATHLFSVDCNGTTVQE